jgi:hypothetical protein
MVRDDRHSSGAGFFFVTLEVASALTWRLLLRCFFVNAANQHHRGFHATSTWR